MKYGAQSISWCEVKQLALLAKCEVKIMQAVISAKPLVSPQRRAAYAFLQLQGLVHLIGTPPKRGKRPTVAAAWAERRANPELMAAWRAKQAAARARAPKLTDQQVAELRAKFDAGATIRAVAKEYGISEKAAGRLCRRMSRA